MAQSTPEREADSKSDPGRVRRLRWMCRRGMKELDVLLEAFLARNHAELAEGSWPHFEGLLSLEDDVLWNSLFGERQSPGADYDPLIEAIRNARTQVGSHGD